MSHTAAAASSDLASLTGASASHSVSALRLCVSEGIWTTVLASVLPDTVGCAVCCGPVRTRFLCVRGALCGVASAVGALTGSAAGCDGGRGNASAGLAAVARHATRVLLLGVAKAGPCTLKNDCSRPPLLFLQLGPGCDAADTQSTICPLWLLPRPLGQGPARVSLSNAVSGRLAGRVAAGCGNDWAVGARTPGGRETNVLSAALAVVGHLKMRMDAGVTLLGLGLAAGTWELFSLFRSTHISCTTRTQATTAKSGCVDARACWTTKATAA